MSSTVTAIYENGVLRPLAPLMLPERTRVRVQIQSVLPAGASEHRRRVDEALVAAGLSVPEMFCPPISGPISAERREELARRFAVGRPLSELIAEEREGR